MKNSISLNYELEDKKKFTDKLEEKVKSLIPKKELDDLNYYSGEKEKQSALEGIIEEKIINDTGIDEDALDNFYQGNIILKSEYIQKIIETYKFTPSEIGVVEVNKKDKNIIFSIRLKMLMNENEYKTDKEFAKEIGVSQSTLSQWKNGKNPPSPNTINKIAKKFNVSTEFLRGETDIRNADNKLISQITGQNEETINAFKNAKNLSVISKKTDTDMINEFGFNAANVLAYIVSDEQLKNIFFLEACKVLSYYTNVNYKNSFESFMNEIDTDLTNEELMLEEQGTYPMEIPTPYKIRPETISKAKLKNEIARMFDNYIDKIMNARNLNKLRVDELEWQEKDLTEELIQKQEIIIKIWKDRLEEIKKKQETVSENINTLKSKKKSNKNKTDLEKLEKELNALKRSEESIERELKIKQKKLKSIRGW